MEEIFPKVENLFDFLSIHREMLADTVRVNAYKEAIRHVVKHGDTVVDVGTGTGILAVLCAKAGARRVYAIECRPVIELAKQIAKENGFADRIRFVRGNSRRVSLPEKVDVVVSEVIGHTVLEENMLDTIIDAKKRFLKKGGSMIPESAKLMFAPTSNYTTAKDLNFWRRGLSGVSLRPAWDRVVNTVYVSNIKAKDLLSTSQVLRMIDFKANRRTNLKGRINFEITHRRIFHGFAAWFEASLTKNGNVCVRTSPFDPPTHWKCAFFPVREPVRVSIGDTISLSLSCYSTGASTVWEWRGRVQTPAGQKTRFSHSSELY